jgi:tetratricopeptide (TPR) repeat protein
MTWARPYAVQCCAQGPLAPGGCAMSSLAAAVRLVCLSTALLAPDTEETPGPVAKANALRRQGRLEDAFLAYLQVEGGEQEAASLARAEPRHYLALLPPAGRIPALRRLLVEGDLRLLLGQRLKALNCYRDAARLLARSDTYPVDWTPLAAPDDFQQGMGYVDAKPDPSWPRAPLDAFATGPGSHQDNWLIRRFITLRAWPDAAAEFARVSKLYRRATPQGPGRGRQAERGVGLMGRSEGRLVFSLDHAVFWEKQGRPERALALLREPLIPLDLDRQPGAGYYVQLVAIRYRQAGREAELFQALQEAVRAGRAEAHRTLALLHRLHGREARALAHEFAYLKMAPLPRAERWRRIGKLYAKAGNVPLAIHASEQALREPHKVDFAGLVQLLLPLYGQAGDTDRLLTLCLKQFDRLPLSVVELDYAAHHFRAVRRWPRFVAWARQRRLLAACAVDRARLWWALGEYARASHELTAVANRPEGRRVQVHLWQQRLENVDAALGRVFSRAFDRADKAKAEAASRQAAKRSVLSGEELKAVRERLRNLEARGASEAAVRLGLDLFDGHGEFKGRAALWLLDRDRQPRATQSLDWSGRDEVRADNERGAPAAWAAAKASILLDCVSIFLPHVRRTEHRLALRSLSQRSACLPLKNLIASQLAGPRPTRLDHTDGHRAAYRNCTVRTPGLPRGVQVLPCRDDVRCLGPRGEWVGTGWGLVRYRPRRGGLDVLQVPLGGAVTALCRTPHGFFAACQRGLYRIDAPGNDRPVLRRIALERIASPYSGPKRLHWWGHRLWLEYDSQVLRYDPVRQEAEDLVLPNEGGLLYRDHLRLFVGAGQLWYSRGRYDPHRGEFVPLKWSSRGDRLIGATSRELWANLFISYDKYTAVPRAFPQNGG